MSLPTLPSGVAVINSGEVSATLRVRGRVAMKEPPSAKPVL